MPKSKPSIEEIMNENPKAILPMFPLWYFKNHVPHCPQCHEHIMFELRRIDDALKRKEKCAKSQDKTK